jgi:hypothetical protein
VTGESRVSRLNVTKVYGFHTYKIGRYDRAVRRAVERLRCGESQVANWRLSKGNAQVFRYLAPYLRSMPNHCTTGGMHGLSNGEICTSKQRRS